MPGSVLLALVVALCLLLGAVVVWLVLTDPARRGGRHAAARAPRTSFRRGEPAEEPRKKRAAVVINPTKVDDVAQVRRELTAVSTRLGWEAPLFLETTAEDPGEGQARQALAEGADLVCPLGGDGTIRATAAALAGTRTPMGLLPRGTGNLLARNLEVPFNDITAAFELACTGRNKAIDVAWLETYPGVTSTDDEKSDDPQAPAEPGHHLFLVMAGMGFDAEIMSGTSEGMKKSVGWPAYFATGFRKLFVRRFQVRYSVDGRPQEQVAARTIVFGNCGMLTGGIQLMPSAELDDGMLDCVVVSPRTIIGWAGLAGRVLAKSDKSLPQLIRSTGERFEVEVDDIHPVQVDGEPVGVADRLVVTVDRQALVVRTR